MGVFLFFMFFTDPFSFSLFTCDGINPVRVASDGRRFSYFLVHGDMVSGFGDMVSGFHYIFFNVPGL